MPPPPQFAYSGSEPLAPAAASDSVFRYFFQQVDVVALCIATIDFTNAQVVLYSAKLGAAISHACFSTVENYERTVLNQLLGELYLKGMLIQAVVATFSEGVALHTKKPFFGNSRSMEPITCLR